MRALPGNPNAAVLDDAGHFALGIGAAGNGFHGVADQLGVRTRNLGNHLVARIDGSVTRSLFRPFLAVDAHPHGSRWNPVRAGVDVQVEQLISIRLPWHSENLFPYDGFDI